MDHNIENKEIRGITFRVLVWIIISTAVICSTVLGTFYSLKMDNAARDVQINDLQARVSKLEVTIYHMPNGR